MSITEGQENLDPDAVDCYFAESKAVFNTRFRRVVSIQHCPTGAATKMMNSSMPIDAVQLNHRVLIEDSMQFHSRQTSEEPFSEGIFENNNTAQDA